MKAQLKTIKIKKKDKVSDDWEKNPNEHVCVTANYSKSRKRLKYGVAISIGQANIDDTMLHFNSFEQALDAYITIEEETSNGALLTEGSGFRYRIVPSSTIEDRLNELKFNLI